MDERNGKFSFGRKREKMRKRENVKKTHRLDKSTRRTIIALLIIAIIAMIGALTNFITDWMWFSEMGYVSVFFKQLFTQLEMGIPAFIILAVVIDFYLTRLKNQYFKKIVSRENTDQHKLSLYTRLLSVVFALLIAIYMSEKLWFGYLRFSNSTPTKLKDPLFHLDISFYLFRLEFLNDLNNFLLGVILLFIVMTVVYYLILITMHTPEAFEDEYSYAYEEEPEHESPLRGTPLDGTPLGEAFKNFTKPRHPRRQIHINRGNLSGLAYVASGQLSVLGIIFYLMLAAEFFLRQFNLLHDHTGAVYGAGYVDVNVRLWIYRALMALSLLGAVTVVHHIHRKELKKIFRIPIALIGAGVIGLVLVILVQNFVVSPDELEKESKYLKRNIEYTQYAYDLNNVSVKKYSATEDLNPSDISENEATFSNIRINDYDPVKTFYNQTQSIRQYYTFNDVDVDRYMINGKLTQTYLSPREIDEGKISETWLNRHLKYTHGYGMTLSQVNAVTPSGQPDVLLKNIPPESKAEGVTVKQPRIYFGELTNDYSLVNTKEDEFDYPDGSENKYTQYEGKAGIKLSPFARFMFALRERSMKLLVSTNLTGNSRIIIYRNVEERVNKIMPYLTYDKDPYSVIVDGKLYWIVDAYTTSSQYPYSEPYSDKVGTSNYIRNSVKVIVDAYNGDVNYYIVDQNDPIARTYQKIYPKLFRSFEQMPEGLKAHLRYPNDMFEVQADIYSKYHMNNVRVFYQDEDRWDVADEIYGTKQQKMTPNYYIVNLPGEKNAEFISSIPFTPKSKQNMTALMIARNDGDHYGEIILYQFPKSKTVYGPMQVEAQIDQNTQISSDFSLWNSAGSKYSRGNLFVVPVNDSLLYIEPVYLEATNSSIPEVKRVIVVYGDTIAYKSTLGDALAELFGEDGGTGTSEEQVSGDESGKVKTQSDYIKEAQDSYAKAQEALKDGDWARYGRYMDQLEKSLSKLKK